MTGYGKAAAEYKGKKIIAEVRSLNSKALDLSSKVASVYREKDMEIRSMVAQVLERGKVEFNLWTEQLDTPNDYTINEKTMASYYEQIKTVSDNLHLPLPSDPWALLMRMPDVLSKTEVQELSDEEWNVASGVVKEALARLVDFRKQEGAALQAKFTEKLDNIERLLGEVEVFEKTRTQKIRQRIEEGLQSIPNIEYDRNRLEQEMIYYIEKLDISEEKQRLANHLRYFRETMVDGHGQGKKLGFIAQEMGREINTTGSKSNQAEMQNVVVMMKDELEQIKEQVLNVM